MSVGRLDASWTLRDLPLEPVVAVPPDATLRDAARAMRARGVSSVLVGELGRPVSILTERDLTMALATDLAPDTAAEAVAVSDPYTLPLDATMSDAAVVMLRTGVRHLIVTDGHRAIGVVSMRDVLAALAQRLSPESVLVVLRQASGGSPPGE